MNLSPSPATAFRYRIARGLPWATFLGAPAPFPVGPYIMASLFQCPVYLLFTLRHGDAAEIHFELFRESICLPRQERDRALDELAAEYARRLEVFLPPRAVPMV